MLLVYKNCERFLKELQKYKLEPVGMKQEFKCADCDHLIENHEVGAWGTRFNCDVKGCPCLEFEFLEEGNT